MTTDWRDKDDEDLTAEDIAAMQAQGTPVEVVGWVKRPRCWVSADGSVQLSNLNIVGTPTYGGVPMIPLA